MKLSQEKGISLWKFDSLSDREHIKHFVTGREGGISPAEFSQLNMSYSAGDKEENVRQNRKLLAQAIGIDPDDLFFVSQYHSDQVLTVQEKYSGTPAKADALITNIKGICICVMGADCVPLLVYDPVAKVAAAIHAGWRGTASGITFKTIKMMIDKYDCKGANIILAIGPSISQDKYEVGEEVYLSFLEKQGKQAGVFFKYDSLSGKYFPDLWEANRAQGLELGLKKENIEKAGICTYSNPNEFFSARFFKNKTGRFAAGIMLI